MANNTEVLVGETVATLTLPQFWPNNVRVWFTLVEAAFETAPKRITQSSTKYYHVLRVLSSEVANEVSDVLLNPDPINPYEVLKETLISRMATSVTQRLKQLLSGEEIGDRKPSQLLRKMRQLVDKSQIADETLREIFIQRLPTHIQAILAAQDSLTLEQTAGLADKILENVPVVAGVSTSTSKTERFSVNEDLNEKLNQVIMRLDRLEGSGRRRSFRPRHHRRSCSKQRKSTQNGEGKRDAGLVLAATKSQLHGSSRLFVTDRKTNQKFLVDTGADLSIIPASLSDLRKTALFSLYTVDGSPVKTFGFKKLTLDLGLRREFTWTFVIASVPQSILGADFLKFYGLVVDISHRELRDNLTALKVHTGLKTHSVPQVTALSGDSCFHAILAKYPDLIREIPRVDQVKHSVQHFIETKGQPFATRARRLAPDKLKIAKKEFEKLLRDGVIRPSSSVWASPLHLVKKTDNTWRCVGDYRGVNGKTLPDRYSIPHLHDFSNNLAGKTVFSSIDLVRAYHQIPVVESDKQKTAVITPFGLYEYNFMPFGLRNAAQTFQRFIDQVVRGLDFVYVYLDDLLVASTSTKEHEMHLDLLFQRLNEYGLVINLQKCVFGESKLKFLGMMISKDGIEPCVEKVQAVRDFKRPETVYHLRKFLGMVNFYRRFISRAATIMQPLTDMLKMVTKKNQKLLWNNAANSAFREVKDALANVASLAYPRCDARLSINVDASAVAVGGVLQQEVNNSLQPIAFFSQKLKSAEQKYSTYDRELLSAYLAVKHFRHLVEGRSFTLYVDHKPLVHAFRQKLEKCSPRQQRHLDFISQFTTDIRYVAGEENLVADTLSRVDAVTGAQLDYCVMAKAQESDPEFPKCRASSLDLKRVPMFNGDLELWCDVSTGRYRPYVPQQFRRVVFNQLHNLSHPGIRATCKLVKARFVWPSISRDVRQWTKTCMACQKAKIYKHVRAPVQAFPAVDARFSHVHLDLVGPLPSSEGALYCLTCVDRYTRWPEAIPIADATAETCAKAFFSQWVSRFGTPFVITTDQGRQFESELFTQLNKLLGCKRIRTVAFNPKANGMVERLHRQLKSALKAHGNLKWTETLPSVLLGIRAAVKEDIGCSSAELVYGQALRLPGEFFNICEFYPTNEFVKNLCSRMRVIGPMSASSHASARVFVPLELSTCSHIFLRVEGIRRSLQAPYEGPYPVVKRENKALVIEVKGKQMKVGIDRVKPAFLDEKLETSSSGVKLEEHGKQRQIFQQTTRSGRRVKFVDRLSYATF